MKTSRILIFSLLFISAQSLLAIDNTVEKILTEESSIQMALTLNPEILGCSCGVKNAKERVREAKALRLPTLSVDATFAEFNGRCSSSLVSVPSQTSVSYVQMDKEEKFSVRPLIWSYIYTGGRISTTIRLANMDFEKMKMEENANRYKLKNMIKVIFNDCLYHKALLEYYVSQIKKYKQQNSQFSNVKLEEFKRKSVIEQFNYEKVFLDLLNNIGIELNTIASISGELKPKIKNIDLENCLLLAYQYKHELKITQQQEIIDGVMLNYLMSMRKYPTISVVAGTEVFIGKGKTCKSVGNKAKENVYLAINLNWPIWDGGSVFTRIKQGKIKTRKSTIDRVKLENTVRLNINKSCLEYDFWKKQAISAKIEEKNGQYDEFDIEIIHKLNKSYYELEFAVGTDLDSY
ncbi:MAG: TolC family protein [Endomicrobium sp.]|jgi:hypothetical protein|nr:TolC family protein [Endomicrobium sp.]